MQHLSSQYQQRQEHFSTQAKFTRKKYDRYSLLRLAVFFVSVALAIFLGTLHLALAAVFVFAFLIGFYRLMQWHQQMLNEANHLERLAAINAEEKGVLEHRFNHFPDGHEYLQTDHPYTLDLDIFGPFSMFQYCCRATTVVGQQRLAAYLLAAAGTGEIASRQAAVSELKPLLDWRQHFQAFGQNIKDNPLHVHMLHEWLNDGDVVRGNKWLTAALFLVPMWTLICLALWAFYLPWQAVLLLFLPTGWLLKKTQERVGRTHLRTTHAADMLTLYAQLMAHIESGTFQSPRLLDLQKNLAASGQSAARHIRSLAYIISQLNVRYNPFAIVLNLGGAWDLQWVYRLEKWKARMHGQLPVWFDSLQEFEALSSFANLWYNNPGWVLPSVKKGATLEAVTAGHPLIHAQKRVGNDLAMPTRGHIKLITGSNMAGKSTFLRTVGLNMVLAQAGAPVCASAFTMPPLQVFTSMRTRDDLSESTSSFYAELKRLKVIIEAVKAAQLPDSQQLPVFFLLDEILKGTNSVDRHTGSKALIQQLIRQQGGGLIATHDLELGHLETESQGAIENLCMEVEVENGQLHFDYTLKKGVSSSFNATLLMREMGIEVG
ncbi:MAG: hypothetical protein R2830_11165 [Saprospiraceae bacterium]